MCIVTPTRNTESHLQEDPRVLLEKITKDADQYLLALNTKTEGFLFCQHLAMILEQAHPYIFYKLPIPKHYLTAMQMYVEYLSTQSDKFSNSYLITYNKEQAS